MGHFTRTAVAWNNSGSGVDKRNSKERTILLVGGAGYIGSVITPHLLAGGYRVRTFDRLLYNNSETILPWLRDPAYEFVWGDMAERGQFLKAIDGVTDIVFLAGLVGDPITKAYPSESKAINDAAYQEAIRAINGCGLDRVIFISTCSNYGLIEGNQIAAEDFELSPLSLYAQAKVRNEQILLGLKDSVDYAVTVLRFATAFGLSPRMRFDLTISEFVRELWLGRELLVYDPDTWRPYCHVQDFAAVIQAVLEAPRKNVAFEVFNAGGDVNNYTKRMIVDEILKYLPDAQVKYQEHGSDPRNYRVDFAKIARGLDFTPRHSVPDGIGELVQALDRHLFDQVDTRRNFHGNYEIAYP
ncbi:MAG: NAD(P)-dependent oxidoreductase [Rhodospirillaceae bacterium]|nr:NAD(P)-dependent oxidoreductase [Rhodospirillaceae bacterium]